MKNEDSFSLKRRIGLLINEHYSNKKEKLWIPISKRFLAA